MADLFVVVAGSCCLYPLTAGELGGASGGFVGDVIRGIVVGNQSR